jgi:hypothetical protein
MKPSFMGLPVERPPSHVWHALSPGGRTSPLGFMGLPVEQQLKQLRNGFSGRCIFVCGCVWYGDFDGGSETVSERYHYTFGKPCATTISYRG